jgi:hypothetical protein
MAQLTINRKNYDKRNTSISVIVGAETVNLTEYVTGVDYSAEQSVEYNYNLLGQPASFGKNPKVASGTLGLTDAGIDRLVDLAQSLGFTDYFELGGIAEMDIMIEYSTYEGVVRTDLLNGVHFTAYNKGLDSDTATYSRDIPLTIGQIIPNYIA